MIRVLVVDDDFMVAKVHRGFVDRVPGFTTVGVAHTGADALAQIDAARPDLVLLDIYLPDITGLEVLRRLREGGDGGPDVLAVTAARDVSTVRSALRGGVVHYVLKPFSFDVLRDRLERYAAVHGRLALATDVGQPDVDQLFVTLRTSSAPMPKGCRRAPGDERRRLQCRLSFRARRKRETLVDIARGSGAQTLC